MDEESYQQQGENVQERRPFPKTAVRGGMCDWRLYNVVILGLSFMFIFSAFQTTSMTAESVIEGARNSTNGKFKGDGYTSLAVIYSVFSAANWIAPSIVSLIGPKFSMMIGGATYVLYILSFLKPMTWAFYLASVLVGLGAAVIWTAQGNFLTINSDSETVGRNSGIFWALLQCSLLFGNIYVYFEFQGEVVIQTHTRTNVFLVLTSVCGAGTLLLLFLRSKLPILAGDVLNSDSQSEVSPSREGPLASIVSAFKLLTTKQMALLCVTFAYTGFELTFFSGVYGTSVGHTHAFGKDAKSYLALCGIFIGVGEILGGLSFGLLGSRTNKFGRDPIVCFGFLTHIAAFYLIFLNLPSTSPIGETSHHAYISSNRYIAFLCAFLLGLGDSSFNTQIYSLLGFLFTDNSAPAFALFKFVQSIAAAIGFFYSNHLLLQYQLLICTVFAFAGFGCFTVVERGAMKLYKSEYTRID